jgi:hypothetical protein
VRALVVVLAAEVVERALLGAGVRLGRPARLGLERAVQALVPPVLLRRAGLREVGQDAQAHPPDAQRREPRERDGRERDAVVAADARRQPVLAEQALEHGPRPGRRRRGQSAAREQEAAVAVGDGERVAVHAVAGLELALEVGGPDRVRRVHRGRRPAGMPEGAAPPARRDEARAPE